MKISRRVVGGAIESGEKAERERESGESARSERGRERKRERRKRERERRISMSVRSVNMDEDEWELSEVARASVREGLANSVRSLAELKGVKVPEEVALEKAKKVEEKAFTAAKVDSRTTTGRRPDDE